jgi:hypothetical protein
MQPYVYTLITIILLITIFIIVDIVKNKKKNEAEEIINEK